MKSKLVHIALGLIGVILINVFGNSIYKRFDITEDQRYTLSAATLNIIDEVKQPIVIDVLLKGNFPAEFKRLQLETRQILNEFSERNGNIIFKFENPLEGVENPDEIIPSMLEFGLIPANVSVQENGKTSNETIFPWAIANLGQRSVRVPLLVNSYGATDIERVNSSVQQLEYGFANAIKRLTIKEKKKIAVIKGNGEISDLYLRDYANDIKEYYQLGAFDMDALQDDPVKTLENLKRFDAMLVVQPTEKFSDSEKYILDQYIMSGGKSMWLMDAVAIDLDSLNNANNTSVTFPRDLNLDDMFFKYGVRINYNIVKDYSHTPITVIDQNNGQQVPQPWFYSPIVRANDAHPITKNLNLIKLEFANQIDTLKNNIDKTILLKSSPKSKITGAPFALGLNEFLNVKDEESYNNGNQTLGVLLEGEFSSVFKNRIKPFKLENSIEDGSNNKMIVISDGDIIKYNISNRRPLRNGIDPYTQQIYGNKDLLINSMNYLMDDNGLVSIRSKEVDIAFLDKDKVANEKTKWQIVNILIPLLLLLGFGVLNHFYRKRKYA